MCPKADTERTRQVCILWHFNAVAVDEENELQKVARLVCPPELMLPIVAVRDHEVEQLDHRDNPVGHFLCSCVLWETPSFSLSVSLVVMLKIERLELYICSNIFLAYSLASSFFVVLNTWKCFYSVCYLQGGETSFLMHCFKALSNTGCHLKKNNCVSSSNSFFDRSLGVFLSMFAILRHTKVKQ